MKIVDSLVENSSIQLQKKVNSWEDAINLLMKPLIDKGAIKEEYPSAIIERTKEIGPFYIIADGLAMPHERGEKGAIKDAFSFLTLSEPVEFPTGEKVDLFIGFAATNSEVHVAQAIPQIVQIFEEDESFDIIRNIKDEKELIEYINKVLK